MTKWRIVEEFETEDEDNPKDLRPHFEVHHDVTDCSYAKNVQRTVEVVTERNERAVKLERTTDQSTGIIHYNQMEG